MSVNAAPLDAQTVLARAASPIVAIDSELKVVVWNEAAERMFGWSAHEVLGGPAPYVPSELRAEYQAAMERVRTDGSVSMTTRRLRKDGTCVSVRVNTSSMGPERDISGWVNVFEEVEDAIVAPNKMQERAQLVRRLAEVIVDINAEFDISTIFSRIAQSLTELTGADAAGFVLIEGEMVRLVSMVDLPDERADFESNLATSLFGELLQTGDTVMVATAETRYLDDLIWADLDGLHTIALGVSNVHGRPCGGLYALYSGQRVGDPELELVELLAGHAGVALGNAMSYQETARQRGHERAVFEGSADGIAVLNSRGRIRKWNRVAAELTGRPFEEVLDKRPFFPVPLPHGDPVTHLLPNGRWLEILSQEIPETNEWVVDFRDVTESKALEDEKDLFLATASHELRTPITVVRGFAQTLERSWDQLDEDYRRSAISTIADRSETLARIVDNLFLGSPEATTELTENRWEFDLASVLKETTTAFESLTERHTLVLDIPDGLSPVYGNSTATDLIVGQLLENALKYSPEGGRVVVAARQSGDQITVEVADNGVGIEDGDRERVFDRFVQGDPGDRRRFGGIGLGLYIARRLARVQGGDVTAHPNTPSGTCMRLRLACAKTVEHPA
ncbi:sensor histidine kinase [Spiractinospora alimapuensis]|uniref:sensor histidine kinase n=1 Tax=Spiractinospora alimapuensis TaxID=2820884 RepID=UPI001F1E5C50|nr:PAS domain S-box protein [Spiractinospora alimapuensis]